MKICTWNSQGNPLNDAIKLNILNHLLTIEQCNGKRLRIYTLPFIVKVLTFAP